MPTDFAIHSDVLVHWTGKDVDKTRKAGRERAYVERLRDILKYGLWMTNHKAPSFRGVTTGESIPCICFTQLKLSQSQYHAKKFGSLGIGFKRSFLFERGGRPLVYYGGADGWQMKDHFMQACNRDLADKRLLHFLKPMEDPQARGSGRNYEFYEESEWRIVLRDSDKYVYDPHDPGSKYHAYFNSLPPSGRKKLQRLIPIDKWLAMIIYPTIQIKALARRDAEIRRLLDEITNRPGTEQRKLPRRDRSQSVPKPLISESALHRLPLDSKR